MRVGKDGGAEDQRSAIFFSTALIFGTAMRDFFNCRNGAFGVPCVPEA